MKCKQRIRECSRFRRRNLLDLNGKLLLTNCIMIVRLRLHRQWKNSVVPLPPRFRPVPLRESHAIHQVVAKRRTCLYAKSPYGAMNDGTEGFLLHLVLHYLEIRLYWIEKKTKTMDHKMSFYGMRAVNWMRGCPKRGLNPLDVLIDFSWSLEHNVVICYPNLVLW